MVEVGDGEEALPVEQLEPAAAVAGVVSQEAGPDGVRDPAGQPSDQRVPPAPPLADHEPKPGWRGGVAEDREEPGDVGRVVLPVAVERHHQRRARRRNPAAHGGRLPARPLVVDAPQPRIARHQLPELVAGRVG